MQNTPAFRASEVVKASRIQVLVIIYQIAEKIYNVPAIGFFVCRGTNCSRLEADERGRMARGHDTPAGQDLGRSPARQ